MSINESQISPLNLSSLFLKILNNVKKDINVVSIGTVIKYNSDNNTCNVQPVITAVQQTYQGNATLPKAPWINLPICLPCGNSGGHVYPISVGDDVLVVFNNRSIDNWIDGTYNTPPNTSSCYHEKDAMIVGIMHNKAKQMKNVDNNHSWTVYAQDNEVITAIRVGEKIAIYNDVKSFFAIFNDYESNQNNFGKDLISCLKEVSIEIKSVNTSIQGLSNKTLSVPAGGLISGSVGSPVSGSTTTTTPTVPTISTATLDALITQAEAQNNQTDSDWQDDFPELFEDK